MLKFHWFAEVTYPHLPEDGTGISPWVDAKWALADPERVGETYRMFLRLLQRADAVGFDGLVVNEHHQTPIAMTPSPNLLASTLASTTQSAAILIIGNSLALYNPPTRVAEEMAFVDCLSNGRLVAGLIFGSPTDTTYSYGMPPIELRERYHEARRLILRAWSEPEPFAFNGKYTQLRYVNVWPRPIQEHPPVWVPGQVSVETWDLVCDEDYCYGNLSFSGIHSARPVVNGFWDHVSKRGGDMNPHRMALTQMICVADTDKEAERLYYDAVRHFHRYQAPAQRFVTAPGFRSARTLDATAKWASKGLTPEDRMRAKSGEMSFWEYDEKGYIIAGSPERVRQRVRELVTELRVGQLITAMHMGNLSEEVGAENTRLFGEEVAPYLRDIWADESDRWTPAASQQLVAANAPKPSAPATTH